MRSLSANKTTFGIHCQGYTPSGSLVLSTSTNHIPTIHNLKEACMYHYEYPEVNTPSDSLNPQTTKAPRVKSNKIDTIINGVTNSFRHSPSSIFNADVHHNNKTRVNNPSITQKAKNSNKCTKKVILIGDSHARNCSFSLQDNLNSDYQVWFNYKNAYTRRLAQIWLVNPS